ncbi:hypothetical protein CQA66_08615 [Helicobacter aurati]|uniref:Sulfatase N-terminal domain-containing protein n=1 Tax=Helicobacter aurati TaxID=137778 RepID=A0A3D8IYY0_9HELI|nr:phosphoethanolamine transferase [Helicobacter aurati]RDU70253.1 hypothetical protein CQA66_08615 [Helicobacter aurati]
MDIFLSTNLNEVQEFLQFYANVNLLQITDTKTSFPVFVLILLLLGALIYKLNLPRFTFSSKVAFLFAVLCFAFTVRDYKYSNALYRIIVAFQEAKMQAMRITVAHKQFLTSKVDSIAKMQHISTQQNIGGQPPYIVIILGESTQRGYMSLYGFSLATSPNLLEFAKSKNLFIFDNIISPATSTNASLEKVLTINNYENNAIPWFSQFNIIDILKIAGYNTTWISNQPGTTAHESVATSIAKQADNASFAKYGKYDESILPLLDSIKQQNTKQKQAYIIHLVGTHWFYQFRYPPNKAHFTDKDVESIQGAYKLTPAQRANKRHYLNAVLYNDFIVASIIERFQNDNAIIFYLSDHGEELYETRGIAGHGGKSHFMVEIPFMIYTTDKHKRIIKHKLL